MNDGLLKFFIILLISVIVLPVFAQGTDTPIVTNDNSTVLEDIVEAADGDVSITNPDNTWLITIAMGMAGVVISIAMLTLAWVAVTGMNATKYSVPPEALRPYLQPVADNIKQGISDFKESAAKTVTPIDDLAASLVQIPADVLMQKMDELGYIVLSKEQDNFNQDLNKVLNANGLDADILSGLVPAPDYSGKSPVQG